MLPHHLQKCCHLSPDRLHQCLSAFCVGFPFPPSPWLFVANWNIILVKLLLMWGGMSTLRYRHSLAMKEIFWYCTTSCDTFCIEQPPSIVRSGVVCVSMCFLVTVLKIWDKGSPFFQWQGSSLGFSWRIKLNQAAISKFTAFLPHKVKKWYDTSKSGWCYWKREFFIKLIPF